MDRIKIHVHAGSLSNYKEVSDQRDVNINRKSQGAPAVTYNTYTTSSN